MAKDIETNEKFFLEEGSMAWDNGFRIFDSDGEEIAFVDMPAYKLVKRLDFFTDETKEKKLFSIVQNKAIFLTEGKYTLMAEPDKPLATFHAKLSDNLLKRNVTILDPLGDPVCNLVEESAVGGFLGTLAGGNFVFQAGEETLGRLQTEPKEEGKITLDLESECRQKLDKRVALGAAIILYARVI